MTSIQQTPAAGAAKVEPDDPGGRPLPAYRPLGELLVAQAFITEAQLAEALKEGSQTGERLGEVVVGRSWATEEDIAKLLAEQWGLGYVDRASIWFDASALARLSREDAQRLEALPMRVEDGRVVVAVAEPTTQRLAALRHMIGDDVLVIVVPKSGLNAGLHSELLGSRNTRVGVGADSPVEPFVEGEADPLAASGAAPEVAAFVEATAPDRPRAGFEQLPQAVDAEDTGSVAAQARVLVELIEAQASARKEDAIALDELQSLRERIEELEAERARREIVEAGLRDHLEEMRRLLADG